jgi:hypothetical protein
LVAGILTLLLFGCGANAERATSPQDDSLRRITLDKSDPERLLRYYFGGYVPGTAQDPFTVGLLVRRDGAIYLEQDSLARWYPEASQYLASGSDALDWDDLKLFLQATYYDARDLPPTLGDLRLAAPYRTEDWFTIELHGVMTTALRRIFVDPSALRTALRGYQAAGERLLYPEGTTIIGEHWLEGEHAETTVMLKRPDGFWDYMTYGSEGTLVPMTTTGPRQLQTPTQCAGCHFGDKQFEPERSFPAEARPGPHGPRAIYVDDALRDLEVTMFFDEHRKRSDYVLGLYNTLFVAQLRADREAGRISDADAALLDALGL